MEYAMSMFHKCLLVGGPLDGKEANLPLTNHRRQYKITHSKRSGDISLAPGDAYHWEEYWLQQSTQVSSIKGSLYRLFHESHETAQNAKLSQNLDAFDLTDCVKTFKITTFVPAATAKCLKQYGWQFDTKSGSWLLRTPFEEHCGITYALSICNLGVSEV